MASRYSQEYFFQHSLMNIPFTDLNEIIHPNAESIPEHIRHFASAIFINGSFWNNPNAVTKELQMEANSDDYISTYLSYLNMLQATYNLVTKGKYYCCFSFLWLPYLLLQNFLNSQYLNCFHISKHHNYIFIIDSELCKHKAVISNS